MERFGIIGFGEVGGIFARDLVAAGAQVAAYDLAPAAQARAQAAGFAAASAQAAARGPRRRWSSASLSARPWTPCAPYAVG